jgi:hypothetical protein
MPDAIDFVVNGMNLHLTRPAVERAMERVEPEPLRSHAVVIGETRYPVKQVFELATGLDRLDFTSGTARRHLAKLGFTLHRVDA